MMAGYAAGAIVSGVLLARVPIRRKARASMLAWVMYLPGYGLMAVAHSLTAAIAGAFFAATGQSSAVVLLNSAAQEEVPDSLLGRVLGVISLTHRGAHATGLLLVAPLFAFAAAPAVFGAAAITVPLVGLASLAGASRGRQASSSLSSSTCEASNPSIRSAVPAAAAAAPAGISPTSSDPTTSAPRASASCAMRRDDLVQRRGLPVLDVHRDLDESRARQLETERANTRVPTAALADDGGDCPRHLDRPTQVDVERDQRRTRAGDHRAGGLVEARRPEVGNELAGVEARPAARRCRRAGRTPARARAAHRGRREPPARPRRTPPPVPRPPARAAGRPGAAAPAVRRRRRRPEGARRRVAGGRFARRRRGCPRLNASTSSSSFPTNVKTDRLWSASAWTSRRRACEPSAAAIASIVAESRPSLKLGTDSSGSTAPTLGSGEGVLRAPRPGL